MKLKSRHAYTGGTSQHFYDVIVLPTRAFLAIWTPVKEHGALLTPHEWSNRANQYPVLFAFASGQTIGAVDGEKIYQLVGRSEIDQTARVGNGEWCERANWMFLMNGDLPEPPINVTLESYLGKFRSPRYLMLKGRNCPLQMIVPFKTRNVEDCTFSLCYNADHGFASNVAFRTDVEFADVTQNGYNLRFHPTLQLTGPATVTKDGTVALTVRLVDSEGGSLPGEEAEAYLECTAGYLPKNRVMVSGEGVTTVKFMALGLDKGDEARVKVGFRNFTGTSDLTLQVV